MDWLDLLAVQETLKSLLQHHSSKASILQHSAFFMVQLSRISHNINHFCWYFMFVLEFMCARSLSHVLVLLTPWSAAHQAYQSTINSRTLLKLMSIESVIPSNHLILHHPLLLLPSISSIRTFLKSQFFASGGKSIGVSASASVHPMNIQDWFL